MSPAVIVYQLNTFAIFIITVKCSKFSKNIAVKNSKMSKIIAIVAVHNGGF